METAKTLTPIVLESAHVAALLDRLSSDDVFRELYKRDTPAALRAVGVPEEAAACIATKHLASKEAIRDARDALTRQLTGTLALHVHLLEAR